jgi:arsenate reductase-like glutaredoxin family protein
MIQIFGTKKCRDTQKALRFFKDRGQEVQFRDISVKPPSPGELDDMASALNTPGSTAAYALLLDSTGLAAKKRGLAYLDYNSREELLANAELYKTPLVRPGKGKVAVGFDEKAWKEF